MHDASQVAPYTGAWIETRMNCILSHCLKSHPIRVRGLKHYLSGQTQVKQNVAPYTGAWIETIFGPLDSDLLDVAPYTGAWIETALATFQGSGDIEVAPYTGAWIETRVPILLFAVSSCRTLYGCVD